MGLSSSFPCLSAADAAAEKSVIAASRCDRYKLAHFNNLVMFALFPCVDVYSLQISIDDGFSIPSLCVNFMVHFSFNCCTTV